MTVLTAVTFFSYVDRHVLLLLAEPALSPVWAWLVHGEAPGLWPVVGGVVIVHSHVYAGVTADGEPRHSHTRTWLLIISDLSLFLTTALILASLSTGIIPSASYRYSILSVKQTLRLERQLFQPRAPPVED